MKKISVIILLLCTAFAVAQVTTTKEGHLKLPTKPVVTSLVDTDSVLVSQANGVVHAISLLDFKILLPSGTDSQSATEVPYSNTFSGINATTAQGAIDSLSASLNASKVEVPKTAKRKITNLFDEEYKGFSQTSALDDNLSVRFPFPSIVAPASITYTTGEIHISADVGGRAIAVWDGMSRLIDGNTYAFSFDVTNLVGTSPQGIAFTTWLGNTPINSNGRYVLIFTKTASDTWLRVGHGLSAGATALCSYTASNFMVQDITTLNGNYDDFVNRQTTTAYEAANTTTDSHGGVVTSSQGALISTDFKGFNQAVSTGDSFSNDYRDYPQRVNQLSDFVIQNYGYSGGAMSNIIMNNWQSWLDNPINANADFFMLQGGTNDIAGGVDLVTMQNAWLTMEAAAVAKGLTKAVCINIAPWAGHTAAGRAQQVIDYNTWLEAQCLAKGYIYIDIYSEFRDNTNNLERLDPSLINGAYTGDYTYTGDVIHPRVEGHITMANMIIDAISADASNFSSETVVTEGTDDQIASEVYYDNTASALPATNLQEAVDELVLASGGADDQNATEVAYADNTGYYERSNVGESLDVMANAVVVIAEQSDDANEISYDNTASGLTATNTQTAIDEIANGINHQKELLTPTLATGSLTPANIVSLGKRVVTQVNGTTEITRTVFNGDFAIGDVIILQSNSKTSKFQIEPFDTESFIWENQNASHDAFVLQGDIKQATLMKIGDYQFRIDGSFAGYSIDTSVNIFTAPSHVNGEFEADTMADITSTGTSTLNRISTGSTNGATHIALNNNSSTESFSDYIEIPWSGGIAGRSVTVTYDVKTIDTNNTLQRIVAWTGFDVATQEAATDTDGVWVSKSHTLTLTAASGLMRFYNGGGGTIEVDNIVMLMSGE